MRPRETEAGLQSAVLDLACLERWRFYHTHDSRHGAAGFPDLVLVKPPRVIFAELKDATRRATPEQVVWLDTLNRCPGVETHLWRPADWDRIEQMLRRRA